MDRISIAQMLAGILGVVVLIAVVDALRGLSLVGYWISIPALLMEILFFMRRQTPIRSGRK